MAGQKIVRSLSQALAHAQGNTTSVRERLIKVEDSVNVREIRKKLSLTQQEFALQFGFSLAAVRHWEQGSRLPEMSARVLLKIIDRDPEYVRQTLGMSSDKRQRRACG